MAGEEFRATLRGSDATLGVVRASDVARLITGLESAVAAAAYAALGRPRRASTGQHDELVLTSARTPGGARLDGAVKERMRRLADAPLGRQSDVLVGTLHEADFDRHTARLHTVTGEAVIVDFPAELADEIQEALREPAAFEGVLTFDPATTTVKRVELRRISIPETLPFDTPADGPPLRLVHPDL